MTVMDGWTKTCMAWMEQIWWFALWWTLEFEHFCFSWWIFLNYLNCQVHFSFISCLLLLADLIFYSLSQRLSFWFDSAYSQHSIKLLMILLFSIWFAHDWLMVLWCSWLSRFSNAHALPMVQFSAHFSLILMVCSWFSWSSNGNGLLMLLKP